jgi:branched-chain amino acid transport system permease protein
VIYQIIINSLISGSIYSLAAIGLALTYSAYKVLNFSHGHLVALSGYLFYLYSIQFKLDFVSALFLSIVSALVIGSFLESIFIRSVSTINPLLGFITTLALSIILESLISIIWGVNVLSLGIDFISPYNFGEIFVTSIQIYIVASAVLFGVILYFFRRNTIMGLRLKAITDSDIFLKSLGISSSLVSRIAFGVSIIAAVLTGIAVGFETNLQPTVGSSVMLKAFAAVVVGGLGNPSGAVFGAFLLGFIENFAVGLDLGEFSLPASYRDSFSFVIILIVLLVKPSGLFSKNTRRA